MKRTNEHGFTVLELVVVVAVLAVGGWLFFTQQARVLATERDQDRKTAINAMYYNLEEVYYPQHKYYPSSIDSKTLRAMDPNLFTDPNGVKLGEANSDYRYNGTECSTDGKCKSYTLRSTMEREAEYVKTSRN